MICVLFVICIYVRAPWENSSCELNGLPYEFINNNNNNNNVIKPCISFMVKLNLKK